MSTTPRTDAVQFLDQSDYHDPSAVDWFVRADFARTLETELAEAKAEAAHYMSVAQKATDDLTRLRADLERFTGDGLLDCHTICDQRDAAVAERDQLRAEVKRLKELLRIESASAQHALASAERAEADSARLNWLAVSDAWFDYPATGAFTPDTMRAAIDAAMKP